MMKRNYALNPVAIGLHNNSLYEPQRQNHFEVYIYLPAEIAGNDQNQIEAKRQYISLATQDFSLPSITTSPQEIYYGNSSIKLAGQTQYGGADSITCNDYIGADVEGILYAWQNLVYNMETGQMGWVETYKTDAKVLEYSPDGYCLASWILKGVWPQGVSYGSLSKGNSGIKQVSVTLSYDMGYRKYGDSTRSQYKEAIQSTSTNMLWKDQNAYAAENPGGPTTSVKDQF